MKLVFYQLTVKTFFFNVENDYLKYTFLPEHNIIEGLFIMYQFSSYMKGYERMNTAGYYQNCGITLSIFLNVNKFILHQPFNTGLNRAFTGLFFGDFFAMTFHAGSQK